MPPEPGKQIITSVLSHVLVLSYLDLLMWKPLHYAAHYVHLLNHYYGTVNLSKYKTYYYY